MPVARQLQPQREAAVARRSARSAARSRGRPSSPGPDRAAGTAFGPRSRAPGSRAGRGCGAAPPPRRARSRARRGSPRGPRRRACRAAPSARGRALPDATRRANARQRDGAIPAAHPALERRRGERARSLPAPGKRRLRSRQRHQPRDHPARRRPGAVGRQQHLDGVLEEASARGASALRRARARGQSGHPASRDAPKAERSRSSEKTRRAIRVSAARATPRSGRLEPAAAAPRNDDLARRERASGSVRRPPGRTRSGGRSYQPCERTTASKEKSGGGSGGAARRDSPDYDCAFLLVELRELRVVDLHEGLAAQLVHVLGEPLLVEVVGDPLAQVLLDLGEGLEARRACAR